MKVLLIALFGAIGASTRYGISSWLDLKWDNFPLGTFLINVLGGFLAAAVFVFATEKRLIAPPWDLALMVGFLGGFTTFSAYSLHTIRLLETEPVKALAYWILTPVLSVGACWFGLKLIRSIIN